MDRPGLTRHLDLPTTRPYTSVSQQDLRKTKVKRGLFSSRSPLEGRKAEVSFHNFHARKGKRGSSKAKEFDDGSVVLSIVMFSREEDCDLGWTGRNM